MAAPTIYDGRTTYQNLAQVVYDSLEKSGWTKEMSILTDGVMRKNYNGADHFFRMPPITSTSYFTVDNPETYVRGITAVRCLYSELTPGSTTAAEVGTITVQNACTTAGNFNFKYADGAINEIITIVCTTSDTTATLAGKIKAALDANANFAASYTTTVSANIITFTKKTNGVTTVNITFDIGITNIAGVMTNSYPRNINHGTSTVSLSGTLYYKLYVWDDHIVLGINPDTGVSYAVPVLFYFGQPKFYGGMENNNWADIIASPVIDSATMYPIRNRTGAALRQGYTSQGSIAPTNPGQGGLMYLAPMAMSNSTDGVRGDFQDIFGLPAAGVQHLDTLTKNGIVHDVWISGTTGTSSLCGTKVIAVYCKNA